MSQFSFSELVDFGSLSLYEGLDLAPPESLGSGPDSMLLLDEAVLRELARRAFTELSFYLPSEQLEAFAAIADDEEAGEAERFVALELLRNAVVAAEGLLPICQDTGTAVVYGWKGSRIVTGGGDEAALAEGAAAAYARGRLRNSQLSPLGFLRESNTGDNLPALVDLRSARGSEYRLCFAAKGGGSANRTTLTMEPPSLLEEKALTARLARGIAGLGPSGCPPYRLGLVLGGSSPEQALYALALANLGLLDGLGSEAGGGPLRDRGWEKTLIELARATGVGAQFGGRHLAVEARAIRMPRHAASLPLALGVACSAHRRARALVRAEGVFLERLEHDPARLLPRNVPLMPAAHRIDLDRPPAELAAELARLPAGSFLLLSGLVVTARDAAHARFKTALERGSPLPDYLLRHPVFYAGPTEAAPGQTSGSFGPTTAGRMDSYLDALLAKGASLVSLAKGGRSPQAAASLARHGGAYLACIGGAAALAAREHILSSELIDHADLGMEAVRLVRLRELPAILAIDARGHDFYARA